MALEDDIAFFEQVPILALLGTQALRILAIGAEARRLQSGGVLCYAGEIADGAYLVQDGSLRMQPGTLAEGEEYFVGRGALINELALITGIASPATAIAKEPSVVVRISRSLFLKTLEGYPAAARTLRDIMVERLQGSTLDLGKVKAMLEQGGNSAASS